MSEVLSEEAAKAIREYFEALAGGLCPTCHEPVEQKDQVGRCVYARPCGHRMFEGKVRMKGSADA